MHVDIEKIDTLSKALRFQTQKYGDKIFMCHKDLGIWNPYTWNEVYANTELVHLGLISLGLQRGDLVGIIGDNDPRWFWAEYAVQAAGSIVAGMYVDYHYAEVKYVLSLVARQNLLCQRSGNGGQNCPGKRFPAGSPESVFIGRRRSLSFMIIRLIVIGNSKNWEKSTRKLILIF